MEAGHFGGDWGLTRCVATAGRRPSFADPAPLLGMGEPQLWEAAEGPREVEALQRSRRMTAHLLQSQHDVKNSPPQSSRCLAHFSASMPRLPAPVRCVSDAEVGAVPDSSRWAQQWASLARKDRFAPIRQQRKAEAAEDAVRAAATAASALPRLAGAAAVVAAAELLLLGPGPARRSPAVEAGRPQLGDAVRAVRSRPAAMAVDLERSPLMATTWPAAPVVSQGTFLLGSALYPSPQPKDPSPPPRPLDPRAAPATTQSVQATATAFAAAGARAAAGAADLRRLATGDASANGWATEARSAGAGTVNAASEWGGTRSARLLKDTATGRPRLPGEPATKGLGDHALTVPATMVAALAAARSRTEATLPSREVAPPPAPPPWSHERTRSIDAITEVPESLFDRLVQQGKAARRRGQHVLVPRTRASEPTRLVLHDLALQKPRSTVGCVHGAQTWRPQGHSLDDPAKDALARYRAAAVLREPPRTCHDKLVTKTVLKDYLARQESPPRSASTLPSRDRHGFARDFATAFFGQ